MYLSTLRDYVEALGGTLELVPAAYSLHWLGRIPKAGDLQCS